MVESVDYKSIPIVYRLEDIKYVGLTAYVRNFADWFFSWSTQHIAVVEGGAQPFNSEVVSVSRGKWLIARVVCLIAFPILLAAKLSCSRASFHVKIVTGNNGDRTAEVRIAPDRNVTFYEGDRDYYTITNDEWELVGKNEGRNGYYSEGRYDNERRLIDGKMYYPDGRIFKEGTFEYKDNGEVWFTGKGKEAVLVRKEADASYIGTFDNKKNLVRGEEAWYGTVYKGEFKTERGITYLSLGVMIDLDGNVTAGRFYLNERTKKPIIETGEVHSGEGKEFHFRLKPGLCVIGGYQYQMGTCDCIRNVNELCDAQFGEIPQISVNEKRLLFLKSSAEVEEHILFKEVEDTPTWHSDTISAFATEVFENDYKAPNFTTDEGKMKLDLVRELCKLVDGASAPPLNIAIWEHILTHYIAKQSEDVSEDGKPQLSDEQLDCVTRGHKTSFAKVVAAIRGEKKAV